MSVASKNPFALLDAAEEEASVSTPAPSADPSKEQPKGTPATRGAQRGKGGPASRGGRYYQRGGAGGARAQPKETPEGGEEAAAARDNRRASGEESRGRGRGRGRGDRSGRPGRGRPFDRHSQTGKTDSDKKIHQGWGGDEGNSEMKAENAAESDALAAVAETTETPAAEGDESKAVATEERKAKEEEEDNTLTLDQYLAKQKESASAIIPKLEVRTIESENFEGAQQLVRDEEDAYFVGKTKNTPKQRTKKEEKVYLEIDAHFDRPQRGGRGGNRGDRSPRGGPRGGRGRGGRGRNDQRSANGHAAQVDVDDEKAFPSLS